MPKYQICLQLLTFYLLFSHQKNIQKHRIIYSHTFFLSNQESKEKLPGFHSRCNRSHTYPGLAWMPVLPLAALTSVAQTSWWVLQATWSTWQYSVHSVLSTWQYTWQYSEDHVIPSIELRVSACLSKSFQLVPNCMFQLQIENRQRNFYQFMNRNVCKQKTFLLFERKRNLPVTIQSFIISRPIHSLCPLFLQQRFVPKDMQLLSMCFCKFLPKLVHLEC